ncbi:ATP-grasp domain-containing protein [Streptomyces sp. HNM0663]|uniref:ATP-grasp domain-containing protein n=1 Tax=Streptomyces chengmaiensis TaxID=3040919 RepID=A0ABT6HSZ1_9ACTN|nr:ATP-grasp domain-containing protein [Streptomyces chengmaiensis]MDH2391480.1 ATP-grasp domain-containing protein [Streptomyces chengmaiensis]
MVTEHGFLALAPQYTTTSELLSTAAHRRGMEVEALPAHGGAGTAMEKRGGHYYGGPAFAARIVDALEVALLEPSDDWLATLPYEYTGRHIAMATLGEAGRLSRPAFVKPPSDKSFPAAVYASGSCLPTGPELSPDVPVQISDVVTWAVEFRLYLLDGEVRTGSQYATFGHLEAERLDGHRYEDAVLEFADDLLATSGGGLPSAVVVDIGLLATPEHGAADQWAVVEANMAWFSNCYAADPDRVLDVVLRSAGPRTQMAERDRPFCQNIEGAHLAG